MIFRIVNFNKELDLYSVISNEGEQKECNIISNSKGYATGI